MALSAEQVCSPYDPEARHSRKRDVTWVAEVTGVAASA